MQFLVISFHNVDQYVISLIGLVHFPYAALKPHDLWNASQYVKTLPFNNFRDKLTFVSKIVDHM